MIQYGILGENANSISSSRLPIYDHDGSDFILLLEKERDSVLDIAVAAGDFDGDGFDEILTVTWHDNGLVNAFIREDTRSGFTIRRLFALAQDDLWRNDAAYEDFDILELGAATADIDGDGRPEAVVGAILRNNDSGMAKISLLALAPEGLASMKVIAEGQIDLVNTAFSPYDSDAWLLAASDLNGDGQDEIVSTVRDIDGPNYACRFDLFALNNNAAPQPFDTLAKPIFEASSETTYKSRCAMAVLDNDRDGFDEVILGLLDPASNPDKPVRLWRREIRAEYEIDAYLIKSVQLPQETVGYGVSSPPPMSFVGADFDGDSLGVKYTGNKWQSLPNPMVLFVVAAPPTEFGISQNSTLTGTTITLSESVGESEGSAYGTTIGVTISAETPDFFGYDILSYEASVSLERAFTRSDIKTQIVTTEDSFEGGSDLDRVIFQGTLFTSYEYEVVAAPNPDLIGTRITIDEPVDTQIYDWSLDFFNATVDPSQRIGPEIMDHAPGDVSSYLRESDKNAFQSSEGFLQTEEAAVGQGDGVRTKAIEITNENVAEFVASQSVEYATGVSVAGLSMTASRGFTDSSIYSITLNESIRYEASVGAIRDPEEYTNYRYNFGMFVRWAERADGAKFQVIDYWVKKLGPGH